MKEVGAAKRASSHHSWLIPRAVSGCKFSNTLPKVNVHPEEMADLFWDNSDASSCCEVPNSENTTEFDEHTLEDFDDVWHGSPDTVCVLLPAQTFLEREPCENDFFEYGDVLPTPHTERNSREQDEWSDVAASYDLSFWGSRSPKATLERSAPSILRSQHECGTHRRVCFGENCNYEVTPYAEIYGIHPHEFEFDSKGNMIAKDGTNCTASLLA